MTESCTPCAKSKKTKGVVTTSVWNVDLNRVLLLHNFTDSPSTPATSERLVLYNTTENQVETRKLTDATSLDPGYYWAFVDGVKIRSDRGGVFLSTVEAKSPPPGGVGRLAVTSSSLDLTSKWVYSSNLLLTNNVGTIDPGLQAVVHDYKAGDVVFANSNNNATISKPVLHIGTAWNRYDALYYHQCLPTPPPPDSLINQLHGARIKLFKPNMASFVAANVLTNTQDSKDHTILIRNPALVGIEFDVEHIGNTIFRLRHGGKLLRFSPCVGLLQDPPNSGIRPRCAANFCDDVNGIDLDNGRFVLDNQAADTSSHVLIVPYKDDNGNYVTHNNLYQFAVSVGGTYLGTSSVSNHINGECRMVNALGDYVSDLGTTVIITKLSPYMEQYVQLQQHPEQCCMKQATDPMAQAVCQDLGMWGSTLACDSFMTNQFCKGDLQTAEKADACSCFNDALVPAGIHDAPPASRPCVVPKCASSGYKLSTSIQCTQQACETMGGVFKDGVCNAPAPAPGSSGGTPWYTTWWFILIACVVGVLLLVLLYKWRRANRQLYASAIRERGIAVTAV